MQGLLLTVTDLNEYVRRMLAGDPMLRAVQLRGEISNFKAYISGHWYFTLKDEQSKIACVQFRQHTLRIRFKPQDGMRVILTGTVGLYTSNGTYQFYAENMAQDGMGELFLRYEQLRERLTKEGLFDPSRKRPLPLLPRAVGIVTSGTGAVIHDIMQVTNRRFPGMRLILRPAQVQGDGAAADIASGITEIAAIPGIDVIIVGRGGGSLEDLWAFNEEIVIRAIVACPIPVISAVGHETDVTLSDFAADMRAPTPSAAAELAVPEKDALIQTVEELEGSALNAAAAVILTLQARLARAEKTLAAMHPIARLSDIRHRAEAACARLDMITQKAIAELTGRVYLLADKISAIGPKQALERGYAIVIASGVPITRVEQARDVMQVLLFNGRVNVRMTSTEAGDPFELQR
jgi:exodeoxyribonuclease VII large subunit